MIAVDERAARSIESNNAQSLVRFAFLRDDGETLAWGGPPAPLLTQVAPRYVQIKNRHCLWK